MKTKNRRVQRFSCTYRIEIFAQERDLVARRTQEQHVILKIHTPRRFDKPLCLDFGDCRLRVAEGIHLEVVEAEILYLLQEPCYVTHHFRPPR